MTKKQVVSLILSIFFLIATAAWWGRGAALSQYPFFWFDLGADILGTVVVFGIVFGLMLSLPSLTASLQIPPTFMLPAYLMGGVLAFFFLPITIWTILAVLLCIAGWTSFHWNVSQRMEKLLHLSYKEALSPFLGHIMPLCLIALTLVMYHASSQKLDTLRFELSDDFGRKFIGMLMEASPPPGMEDSSQVVDTEALVEQQIEALGGVVSEEEREIIETQVQQEVNRIASSPEAVVAQQDAMYPLIKKQLEDQMNGLIDRYKPYLPYISAFLFFSLMSIANILVSLLVFGVVYGGAYAFQAMGIVSQRVVMKKGEELVWEME